MLIKYVSKKQVISFKIFRICFLFIFIIFIFEKSKTYLKQKPVFCLLIGWFRTSHMHIGLRSKCRHISI